MEKVTSSDEDVQSEVEEEEVRMKSSKVLLKAFVFAFITNMAILGLLIFMYY